MLCRAMLCSAMLRLMLCYAMRRAHAAQRRAALVSTVRVSGTVVAAGLAGAALPARPDRPRGVPAGEAAHTSREARYGPAGGD